MSWIKKYLPGGGGGGGGTDSSSTPFIIGSDKWMGSTAQHKGEKAEPAISQPSLEDQDDSNPTPNPNHEIARSRSFAPSAQPPSTDLPRSVSMDHKKSMYPKIPSPSGTSQTKPSSAAPLYPKIYEQEEQDVELESDEASVDPKEDEAPLDPREECLVTIPNAIVHLVDENQSPHLATGHLSIVRIGQKGNSIVVLVRVGENLHWPLMKDVPSVRLDNTHYFFSLPVPPSIDASNGSGSFEVEIEKNDVETLNYGVTFPDAKNYKRELQQLDDLLTSYSSFSSPTLVQGDDKRSEALAEQTKELSLVETRKEPRKSVGGEVANLDNLGGGKVVSSEVLSTDGKQGAVTEANQAEFWTTMAPNVDDYGSSAARAIAQGSGHVIRGIFWVRDSTVTNLESGTIYFKSKLNPGEKPRPISPTTLKNLNRVRKMSRATENVAKSVLKGIVTTAGFFSGSVIKSRAGKKVFKLMPGEVALVSLDAFAKVFDALEKATTDVLQSTSLMTQNVVSHKFGEDAGQVTQETLATVGHVAATAWTISKLRKALNPKEGVKPTKTAMVKGMAKNALRGGK